MEFFVTGISKSWRGRMLGEGAWHRAGGTHTPKYLDQLLRIEIKKIFKVMCSFDQNIGLLPLVSTVSQK